MKTNIFNYPSNEQTYSLAIEGLEEVKWTLQHFLQTLSLFPSRLEAMRKLYRYRQHGAALRDLLVAQDTPSVSASYLWLYF